MAQTSIEPETQKSRSWRASKLNKWLSFFDYNIKASQITTKIARSNDTKILNKLMVCPLRFKINCSEQQQKKKKL